MNKQIEFIQDHEEVAPSFLNLLVIVASNAQTVAEKLSIFAAHSFCVSSLRICDFYAVRSFKRSVFR